MAPQGIAARRVFRAGHLWLIGVGLLAVAHSPTSHSQGRHADVDVVGEYLSIENHGYLRVSRSGKQGRYLVWLGVGGGSCGGETHIDNKIAPMAGGALKFEWKRQKKRCVTTIELESGGATVTDSCISASEESNATCAILGEYRKR